MRQYCEPSPENINIPIVATPDGEIRPLFPAGDPKRGRLALLVRLTTASADLLEAAGYAYELGRRDLAVTILEHERYISGHADTIQAEVEREILGEATR